MARLLTAALAMGVGLGVSPRVQAGRPGSDPAGVYGCQHRSPAGGRGLLAAVSFEPGALANEIPSAPGLAVGSDRMCATTLPAKPTPDGPAPGVTAGRAAPYGFSSAVRDPLRGSLNAGKSRAYQGGAPASVIVLFGQFGFIRDRIDNARRARLRFGFQPAPHLDLGLCATDGFSDIPGTGLSGRCLTTVETEISYVFALGRADFISRGEVGGVGGKFQYDLSAPIKDGAALVASLSYRRVPTMIGRAPDIKRLESAIKYHFHAEGMFGVDLGLTGGKGTEPKSLRDENKIQVGVGLTF